MKNKAKKNIKFFKQYLDSPISKGIKEEIKTIDRKYNKHRAKSVKDKGRG